MKKKIKFLKLCTTVTFLTVLLAGGMSFCLPPKDLIKAASKSFNIQGPGRDSEGTPVYDYIYFGSYPQSDVNGQKKDPIKWRVLSVKGDDAFLVSDKNLDAKAYNETDNSNVTWENCTMRSWLNGYKGNQNICGIDYSSNNFLNMAFTKEEQEAIFATNVTNKENPLTKTRGGNDTVDKIFLLSYEEITNEKYGFSGKISGGGYDRIRKNTAYLGNKGGFIKQAGKSQSWWLRSPGFYQNYAMLVYYLGNVRQDGEVVYDYEEAVCPALHLNLTALGVYTKEKTELPGKVRNLKSKKLSSGKVKLSWKKEKKAAGYQVVYALNKNFKKQKTVYCKQNGITLKKLKKGNTYFVKVRAYQKTDEQKLYGKWSKKSKLS